MANQKFQRTPNKGTFAYTGMSLQRSDALPPGRAQMLINVETDLPRGRLQARPGLTRMGTAATDNTEPVHSMVRFIDPGQSTPLPPGENAPSETGQSIQWIFGSQLDLYMQTDGSTSGPTRIDMGYSGNPLSMIPYRPPQSASPRLYVFDSQKQAKYRSDGTAQNVGVFPPAQPPVTALGEPAVLPIADITSTTGWNASGVAANPTLVNRVADNTTIETILYDSGSSGWCSIQPTGTSFAYTPTLRPSVILNGWGGNAHVGAYEMGQDQGHSFGLNSGSTAPYSNPNNVSDGDSTTYASAIKQQTHTYCGCVWAFTGYSGGIIQGADLNILSQIPADQTNGLTINNRSAGVWYSVDAGVTWTKIYDEPATSPVDSYPGRALQWDTVTLAGSIDPSKVQVMAFMDAHDDFAHYVFEINLSSSSHNAAFAFGARLQIGSEIVTVSQFFPSYASTTVAGVLYDAGSSGMATVQATTAFKLQRNAMVFINSAAVRILSVTDGPDGLSSFRCVLPSGIAAGQAIQIPVSFRCYTTATHAAGDAITSQLLSVSLAPGLSNDPAQISNSTGLISMPVTLDLTQLNNRPLTPDDYMHISLRFDHPENVTEVHVMVDVDQQTNDFTGNYFFKVVQQNEFQDLYQGGESTRDSLLGAMSDQLTSQFSQDSTGSPDPDSLPLGSSQFYELMITLNDLTRSGTDPSASLAFVKAIGLRAIVTGPVALQFGSWWVGGTYGPDANWNSAGNQGQPILYRYRYRSSTTGAFSNPSPATRSGELPVRGAVSVSLTASTDPQVDLIDIERNGGTFDTWALFMTVPNATGAVLDVTNETVASAGQPAETDAFPPWPVTDTMRTITGCTVVGTSIFAPSGTPFNTRWARGSEVIVNNQTYSLHAPPNSTNFLETEENVGVLTNVSVQLPEATIMGVPLPYVAGPFDGRFFATGDPLNPGLLYFSKPGNPDTASDAGWIEITSPGEPLMMPVIYEGRLYVYSNTSLYSVESTQGGANPYAAYKLGTIPSGLVAPWAVAAGPALSWLGADGIYLYGGAGGAKNITRDDLDILFRADFGDSSDKQGGVPDANGHYTCLPVDLSTTNGAAKAARLAWVDNRLYFDYQPAGPFTGNVNTLVYDLATEGWMSHQYMIGSLTWQSALAAGAASMHYQPPKMLDQTQSGGQPVQSNLYRPAVVGGANGRLYVMNPNVTTDDGSEFLAQVVTPFDDQGDVRARKQYGDVMLDYTGAGTDTQALQVSVLMDNSGTTSLSVWKPVSANNRTQAWFDLGLDSVALHRNIALRVLWTSDNNNVALYEWQPSFFPTPEDTANRPTDWTDCGSPHYKFVHGLRIDADTGGVARTVQLQYDGGQLGATLMVNHAGEMVKPYSFPPFKAHLVRLVPNDANNWRLFSVEYEVDPEPDATSYWVSQPSTFDMPGFLHIRDLQFAYATDTAGGALNVIVDGVTYPLIASLPVTGMVESKLYVPAPPIKGKLWQLEATGTNLQVYERDCEFRIKPWGADSYQVLKPLGDATRSSGGARL